MTRYRCVACGRKEKKPKKRKVPMPLDEQPIPDGATLWGANVWYFCATCGDVTYQHIEANGGVVVGTVVAPCAECGGWVTFCHVQTRALAV